MDEMPRFVRNNPEIKWAIVIEKTDGTVERQWFKREVEAINTRLRLIARDARMVAPQFNMIWVMKRA